jgi:serine/threonine-protein kinase
LLPVCRSKIQKGPVQVPNVEGLSEARAGTTLASAGLTVDEVEREPNDTIPAGQAIRTSPPYTEELKPGTAVTLVISSGPTTVIVPTDLEGRKYAEAEQRLTGLGLTAARRDVDDRSAARGEVVGVEKAGERVPRGTSVSVYVALPGS